MEPLKGSEDRLPLTISQQTGCLHMISQATFDAPQYKRHLRTWEVRLLGPTEKKRNILFTYSPKCTVYHWGLVFVNPDIHVWRSGELHVCQDHCLHMMAVESVLLKLSLQGRRKYSGLCNKISWLISQAGLWCWLFKRNLSRPESETCCSLHSFFSLGSLIFYVYSSTL